RRMAGTGGQDFFDHWPKSVCDFSRRPETRYSRCRFPWVFEVSDVGRYRENGVASFGGRKIVPNSFPQLEIRAHGRITVAADALRFRLKRLRVDQSKVLEKVRLKCGGLHPLSCHGVLVFRPGGLISFEKEIIPQYQYVHFRAHEASVGVIGG